MPAWVKIKAGKYGKAINLLLMRGGTFQTRHERTPIVNSEQKKVLEDAGVIEIGELKEVAVPQRRAGLRKRPE